MKILDCTLRDGANVVGKGFNAELTEMMVSGLIEAGITTIEMGNAVGMGGYEANNSIAPLTDKEYLDIVKPYLNKAEIGMFILHKNGTKENIELAASYGLKFLRVGANAGDGHLTKDAIGRIKEAGLECKFAIMKSYILTAEELAKEAAMLVGFGVDEITIMDSAGTMIPEEVEDYVRKMVESVEIPVGFHGHNNLGLSIGNTLAAYEAGATVFDSGLLGMARSAGNSATELIVPVFQRKGLMEDIDLLSLLDFLDKNLIPAMNEYDYTPAVKPLDIVLGLSGCHSSNTSTMERIANEKNISEYVLISEVSKIDRKTPSEELIYETAEKISKNNL